jgi:hypothetical protein
MSTFELLLYFLFIQATLLIPGFAITNKFKKLFTRESFLLVFSYIIGILVLSIFVIFYYIFGFALEVVRLAIGIYFTLGFYFFFKNKLYKKLLSFRFPLLCLLFITILPTAFASLSYESSYKYIPDPEAFSQRNYDVYNVKILNLAQTQANDNYVPYRQAQFIVNRSDPGNDCFICEWGVHYFQRTPLMGTVTAGYFMLLGDRPPVDYLWSGTSDDPSHTYIKFQLIAHILNGIFIIPAYYLLLFIFNKRTAILSSAFLIISPFFMYNAVFSWPKSLVAFFVLAMWLLLYEHKTRFTVLAGFAGGLAFLTHDLAAFYIVGSVLFLIFKKRFRDTIILSATTAAFALPWLITSSLLYKKPSTFALYPFSLDGLPQPGTQKQVIEKFLNTSPIEIISIRFDTLFYLLSPYDLIYKNANQDMLRRFWATGLYSIPGSLGLWMIVPTLLGAIKKLVKLDYWILVLTPILLSAAIVGWRGSRAIASLHFAQAVIVMLTGLAFAYLVKMKFKYKIWLIYLVFVLQIFNLGFLIFYSYPGIGLNWFITRGNILPLISIFIICSSVLYIAFLAMKRKAPKWI